MEDVKALIKEQNELLKRQNDILEAGFTSLMAVHLYELERKLFELHGDPEIVAHKMRGVTTGLYLRQAQEALKKNLDQNR